MRQCILLAAMVLSFATMAAQETLTDWQKGWMDIHTVAVGAGECTFVIMPDGTTMMIDAGDVTKSSKDPHNYPNFMDDPSRTVGERTAEYILDFSTTLPHPEKVDYFLLTHFHRDHMGQVRGMVPGPNGYGLSGITQLGEFLSFGKFVDRGWPDYDFEVWNIAASGVMATGRGKTVRNMTGKKDDPALFDENMNSTVVLMRYGPFTYYNGGDICGRGLENGSKRDMESQIADICGRMTVVKADHHGWKDSCNPYFLWKTRPQAVLIPAFGNTHPWIATLRRLSDPHYGIKGIFATTRSAEVICKDEMNNITAIGHIVVRVYEGGEKWQVFVLDNKDKGYKVKYSSDIMQTR